jgi:thioredoxin-dependent peroxiredoxin
MTIQLKDMSNLKIKSKVPTFSVIDQDENQVSSKSLLGKKYILFFYGQDDTPTCTKQVCAADAVHVEATKKGFAIYGVSPDKPAKHKKFIDKYKLNIHLLSDPTKEMMYAFNAYGPKIFMGKEVIGVYRKAYFIDEKGIITGIVDEVNAAKQGDQLIEILG